MGLNGHVRCNCFAEGAYSPPPFDADLLVLNREGEVDLRWDQIPENRKDELWAAMYCWKDACCPHPQMRYGDERLGSWSALRQFQQTLWKLDEELFPVLIAAMPEGNTGKVDAALAPSALRELDLVRQRLTDVSNWFLVDVESDEIVFEYIEDYCGEVAWGEYLCGFDPNGYYVTDRRNREIFRARRFRQVLELTPDGEERWVLRDGTGQSFTRKYPIGDRSEANEFEVRHMPLSLGYVQFYEPLRRLFIASLETGNPVQWT